MVTLRPGYRVFIRSVKTKTYGLAFKPYFVCRIRRPNTYTFITLRASCWEGFPPMLHGMGFTMAVRIPTNPIMPTWPRAGRLTQQQELPRAAMLPNCKLRTCPMLSLNNYGRMRLATRV